MVTEWLNDELKEPRVPQHLLQGRDLRVEDNQGPGGYLPDQARLSDPSAGRSERYLIQFELHNLTSYF